VHRVRDKLIESMFRQVRTRIIQAKQRFRFLLVAPQPIDERVVALAATARYSAIARILATSRATQTMHLIALQFERHGWVVTDG